MSNFSRRIIIPLLIFTTVTFLNTARSEESTLPQYASDLHLGVATCSGSTCHGAAKPFDTSSVMQNEFIIWQRQDAHANAYKVLYNEDSKRIARNLGLQAAHTAKICLDCHSDNVAPEHRGKRFQSSDGVGCEACHGGAERYLGTHVSGIATHQQNIDNGLYPSEDPIKRAKLCLSCHFGNANKFVTHRIMGAGHPRMSFELDTFTAIMPAHYRIDKDYTERKQVWSNVRVWAVGQAMAVNTYLTELEQRMKDTIFPELVFFDCHACHHSMRNKRWAPRASTGLEPGVVRLNDSSMLMLRHIASIIDPGLGKSVQANIRSLHQASTQSVGAMQQAARALRAQSQGLIQKIAAFSFSADSMRAMANNLLDDGIAGEYVDYAGAEQSLMAIEAITATLQQTGQISAAKSGEIRNRMDALYKVLKDDDAYKPSAYISGLKSLKPLL